MLKIIFLIQINPGESLYLNNPFSNLIFITNKHFNEVRCINLNLLNANTVKFFESEIRFQKIVEVEESINLPCYLYLIEGYSEEETKNIEFMHIASSPIDENHLKFFDKSVNELSHPHFRPVSSYKNEADGTCSIIILVHNMFD